MAQRIRIRRDTQENWEQNNPVLSLGEQGYVTDTGQLKIGDGTTAWNSLPYYRGFFSSEMQEKLAGIETGAEKNIIKSASIRKESTNVPISPDANGNINIDVSDKVDKVSGKGLSTNDYSTDEKEKLSGIQAGANKNTIEKLYVNGIEQTIEEDKSVNIKIDNRKKYGVRRCLENNSSPTWERIGDSIGLVANACINGNTSVRNDFDSIYPWSAIISYNYNLTTHQRVADYGDPDYRTDGSNGIVLTQYPEFYYDRYTEVDSTDNKLYEYIWISEYVIPGFKKSKKFSIGRYESNWDGSKLLSISGAIPEVSRNIKWFRDQSRALGTGFGQQDYRIEIIKLLYLVEYATYYSQSALGGGITSLRYTATDKSLIAETNTNRIVIASNPGYIVGQQIDIGTSQGGRQIAKNRTVTAINDYSAGGVTGKSIVFDGTPVNIAVDNLIYSCGQFTGQCDSLGMRSGCLSNDSKHAIIYRGVENIFGNIWKFVDGINIKDYEAYVCYDPSQYVSDKFTDPYKQLSYGLFRPAQGSSSTSREGWAKTLGYDEDNSAMALTTDVGGSSTTYMTDYAYINSGNRIAMLGGYWNFTADAGLWYWYLNHTSSATTVNIGSRLLLDQD